MGTCSTNGEIAAHTLSPNINRQAEIEVKRETAVQYALPANVHTLRSSTSRRRENTNGNLQHTRCHQSHTRMEQKTAAQMPPSSTTRWRGLSSTDLQRTRYYSLTTNSLRRGSTGNCSTRCHPAPLDGQKGPMINFSHSKPLNGESDCLGDVTENQSTFDGG